VRLAFAFLLSGTALRFLAFGPAQIALVGRIALISGIAGFVQGDGNRLPLTLPPRPLLSSPCLNSCITRLVIRFCLEDSDAIGNSLRFNPV
jgi:hypothetical protein